MLGAYELMLYVPACALVLLACIFMHACVYAPYALVPMEIKEDPVSDGCDLLCEPLMWDSPLYAVNMFYYHWIIKKLLQPMAGQNIARLEGI